MTRRSDRAGDDPRDVSDDAPPGAVPVPRRTPTPLYAALSRILLRLEARVRARGSRRIRWITRLAWAVIAGIGLLLLIGPVINKPLSFDDITSSASTATETWIARSFDAEFTVARDGDGRMSLEVVERIGAYFPDDVSETGIERVIASQYQSHDLRPAVTGVTMDGRTMAYTTSQSPTRTTIRVDTGERLRGDHEFMVSYTLHDVVYSEFDASTHLDEEVLHWDVFGPDWPHGVARTAATIHVPKELDEEFTRAPGGGLAWLLLSDAVTLTPDRQTPETVTYVLENDQNIPPHASFWFTFGFTPGTFAMPAPSLLYWVQVIGPFVPLILLAVTVLFAFAARAVAWADARGRAWFVHQTEPQRDVSPQLAARLWRAVTVAPLVDAVTRYQAAPVDDSSARALVHESRRAGRLGHVPAAWIHYFGARVWREQFRRTLRRVPHGFVRDSFIGAALALTVLQWGLVRQLSYQFSLSRYWWPIAVLAATVVLAALILTIALTARPLTRRGALAREHLMGLELFVGQTSAAERSSLRDPLLPYAVMFSPARTARRIMTGLIAEAGLDRTVRHDPEYIGPGRMAIRVASVLSVVVALAVAVWLPLDRSSANRHDAAYGWEDLPGDYGTFVTDFEARGVLSETRDGGLVLRVEERLRTANGSNFREVPQVLRQWDDVNAGQRAGLTVEAVTVDGHDVPFTQSRMQGMALLQTQLSEEWPGEHDVVIRYVLHDPVAVVDDGGGLREQVKWVALNNGWHWGWESTDTEVESVAVSLQVPRDLVARSLGDTGWVGRELGSRTDVEPFGPGEADGADVVFHDALERDDEGQWVGLRQYTDITAQLEFPLGTYTDGSTLGYRWYEVRSTLPHAIPLVMGAMAVLIGAMGVIIARVAPRALRGGMLRDLVRWVPAWFTAAIIVMLFPASVRLPADDARLAVVALAAGLSALASVVVLIVTRRARTHQQMPTDG